MDRHKKPESPLETVRYLAGVKVAESITMGMRDWQIRAKRKKDRMRERLRQKVRKNPHIKPNICSKCGKKKSLTEIEGHHETYASDVVTWLCHNCHKLLHAEDYRMHTERTMNMTWTKYRQKEMLTKGELYEQRKKEGL